MMHIKMKLPRITSPSEAQILIPQGQKLLNSDIHVVHSGTTVRYSLHEINRPT